MPHTDLLTALGVGFLLGLRHAFDADHLAAVSTVLAERPSLRASSAVGFWWGIGHTATLLAVGGVVLAMGLHLPSRFETIAEAGVALVLIVLGASLAWKLHRERWHLHSHQHQGGEHHLHLHSHQQGEDHRHRHWMASSVRPLCIGMAHGVAGSAAVLLMIVSATDHVVQGLLTIAVFGVGSIIGMMAIGFTISLPLVCSLAVSRRFFVALQGCASAASLLVGISMLAHLSSTALGS